MQTIRWAGARPVAAIVGGCQAADDGSGAAGLPASARGRARAPGGAYILQSLA